MIRIQALVIDLRDNISWVLRSSLSQSTMLPVRELVWERLREVLPRIDDQDFYIR